MGRGGPPEMASFETWWLDEMVAAPDHVLEPIVADVRSQFAQKNDRGLAELLDAGEAANVGPEVGLPGDGGKRLIALRSYASAAKEARAAQASTYPACMPS